ncbi:MmpS family transport accessory protein [Mycobacterium ulcerans]
MSGPNPPGWEPDEPDPAGDSSAELEPFGDTGDEPDDALAGGELEPVSESGQIEPVDPAQESEAYSRAYSAPESEQFISGAYLPADLSLYDYDGYDDSLDEEDEPSTPRWPWVVGVAAIMAAIALVASVSLLVTRTDSTKLANPATTSSVPPVQDEITTTKPPPPTTTTPAGPRQVTYSVTGTKAPGDIISVTYVDASGRRRTQHNVYIPWSMTVTPISQSDVGSVEASSLFRVSRLNCSITTSDGTVLSSNSNDAPQTSC